MKIGILGTGHIGKTLVATLSATGHEVKVANSRGPETIGPDVLAQGGRAVSAADVVLDVDIAIVSVPLNRLPDIAPFIGRSASSTVVIDTSNYYPQRDGRIDALEDGLTESLWVADQLGRPVVKAWNAIGSDSFAKKGKPAGSPDRIAIPVAADDEQDRKIALALVEDTGFDGFDAGVLAESWRQQPGTPCYCTDLSRQEMPGALAAADPARSPKLRDLAFEAVLERMSGSGARDPGADYLVRLNRALFL
ncbi:NADPH-dependent F420 reductase [Nocardia fusca]|uniref:NAD(P)-binding domain-containing protein n=1 Tax=Nocardia fusca TaxID=941183 RepID=A0ABV3FJI6_9NOCA